MFATKHYKIVQLDNDPEEFCWGVRNVQYETIEHKAYSLPNAIMVCQALTEQLEGLMKDPTAVHLSIVPNETIN